MAVKGVTRNFYKKFKFVVEIAGVRYAGFQTMSELRMSNADIDHHEGGSLIPDKQPGRVSFPDVTLTRGATDDEDLWNWMKETSVLGQITEDFKRTIDVVQQDRAGNELKRWTLVNTYAKEFKAGDWDNNADENVMEEIVLRYDFFDRGGDGGL